MNQSKLISCWLSAAALGFSFSPALATTISKRELLLASPVIKEEEAAISRFLITYIDNSGHRVGSQEVNKPVNGVQTLNQSDLELPFGFLLNEEWQMYQVDPGSYTYIEFSVLPDDPTLAAIYSSQVSSPSSLLTVNSWLEDGTLVNSQTFGYYSASAGGTPVRFLNENYAIHVPEGYERITQPPQSIQVGGNDRGIIDLYVVGDGTDADGSITAIQDALNGTIYLGEVIDQTMADVIGRPDLANKPALVTVLDPTQPSFPSTAAKPSGGSFDDHSSSIVKKSPHTAANTGFRLGAGMMAASLCALAASWTFKCGKDH